MGIKFVLFCFVCKFFLFYFEIFGKFNTIKEKYEKKSIVFS